MLISPASSSTMTEMMIIRLRLPTLSPSTVPIIGDRRSSVSPPLASAKQHSKLKPDEPAVARSDQPAAPLVGVSCQRDPGGQLGQDEGQDHRADCRDRPEPDGAGPNSEVANAKLVKIPVVTEMTENDMANIEKSFSVRRSSCL